MIKIRQLVHLNPDNLSRLVTGYTSNARYLVNKAGSERKITFTLELVPLPQPYIKRYDPIDAEPFDHYQRLPPLGFSFGAYDGRSVLVLPSLNLRHGTRVYG